MSSHEAQIRGHFRKCVLTPATALQFLALVDDIYLSQGKSVWSGVSFKPRSPFEERKVPAVKVVPEVAVLGASGFIGSRIVAHLTYKGISIRCGVHTRELLIEHLDKALIEFFPCDTSDSSLLSAFLKGQKVLIYAAGLTTAHGQKSWEEYLSANVHDVLHIVSAAREAGIEKLVFLGSQAPSYGRYGFSKALGEEVVRESGLNYVILKPGLVVGWQGLASAVIRAIEKLPLVPVPRKSAENTELVDVETVAKAVVHVMDDRSYNGKRIYLGSATAVSLENIIDLAAYVSRKKVIKVPIPHFFLAAGSMVANAVFKKFPLNAEVIEGIYRRKPALPSDAVRLFDEEPADVLRRYVL
jgi:NADH dehydrogenase